MTENHPDLDVVIIGAGPAGLSAGIWCKDIGLNAVIFERESEAGGQLLSIFNPITNYPGLRTENGREMRDRFLLTAAAYGVDIRLSTEVVEIDPTGTSVRLADGQRISSKAVILASGVRRRRLDIPGEAEFAGRGIIVSGSKDKELARNKTVAVIGGGDAALENALILSKYAKKIYVIHRRDKFSARREFTDAASAVPSIEFVFNSAVQKISGSGSVKEITVHDRTSGDHDLSVDLVLIRIGVEPNSGLIKGVAGSGPNGYLRLDSDQRVIGALVYGAGDVANQAAPTIVTAAGAGAAAAKAVLRLSVRRNYV
ncbi:MAG: FAD-dependent oxidoreductase [Acidobacteria bacterium]|nr:FAD-dependent oxidoreductase [Acidobacteriota bacterium]